MAKRKRRSIRRSPYRRTRRWFTRYRKTHDTRIPISGIAGTIASVMGSPDGWESPMSAMQRGAWDFAAQSFIRNMTGVKLGMPGTGNTVTSIDIWRVLNPFDFGEAPALKTFMITALTTKFAKKFFGITDSKKKPLLPVIGKYLRVS